ncbi:MAG: response regulator [Bacteriovoracaceae bacterium]|nr:response regulator [Bacteriovoracaceae bacterium]
MDKKQVVQDYLTKFGVLVVDKNSSSRNRLLKVMVDLGTKRHMIHTAGSMVEAEQILKENQIGLVLSDYVVGGGSGFDLFKVVRSASPNNKKLCLILVTSNISQTAVAKAAEEDVDSFIIKPYTLQSIHESLISTISAKIQPSPYILKVEEGKELIAKGDYRGAIAVFEAALPLHQRPSLALFYMGQAQYMMTEADQAKGKYNKGLSYNSIHFKCLVGLYEIFMKEKKFEEAYQVVKKVAKYFPANPDRLTQIIRLAIVTKNYEDMESYYDIFTQIEERNAEMTNYIGAGLFVAGKWFMNEGQPPKALAIFEKIAVSCSEFSKFMRAIITFLVENNQTSEAEKYISRFSAGTLDHEDFILSDFLIRSSAPNVEPAIIIKKGMDIYNKNIRDYLCLKMLVEAMQKQGLQDKAQPYIAEIEKLYPDKLPLQAVS